MILEHPKPDPRIADYIAEIEKPGIPYVSTSHLTLFRLGAEHGHGLVAGLIKDYFNAVRQFEIAADSRG